MALARHCVLTLFFFLLAAPMLWAQSAKTSIIIERQLVRFITPGEAVEWRLIVANQPGEVIYDSGPVYGNALDWPLKNQQGEAVASGLYTYTLTSKAATEETARTQRGHLMLARPSESERIWITNDQSASIGADSSAVKLAVISSGETTVGGAELPGAVPRREVSAEQAQAPQRASVEATAEKATAPTTPDNTANRVAKFAADGSSLVDSAITEVGGSVGIGTTNPQSNLDYRSSFAPFFTRDIGPNNALTAQSALQLGLSNAGSRFPGVGPSMLFFGENSAGAKSFLGRVSSVWENPTAGAEAGALFFQTRASSGDANALTERMRITASGNVGIGTPNPTSRLEIAAQDGLKISGYQPFFTLHDASTGRSSYLQGINGDLILIPQSFAGCCAAMVIKNFSGNVGIGVSNPTAKLQVVASNNTTGVHATSQGNAIAGISTTGGYAAIYGENTTSTGFGVYGKSGSIGVGVWGEGRKGVQGKGFYGVFGTSTNPDGAGVYGEKDPNCPATSVCYAGFFAGSVKITGRLNVDGNAEFANYVQAYDFIETSDRNVKANFASVDTRAILQRLAAIPIQTWNFKSQPEQVRHIGPMAQDFRAAFNLGHDDKHISTIDADGVALAAIQGLYQLVQEKEKQLEQQSRLLNQLQARLVRLEHTAKKRSAARQRMPR